MARPRQIKNKDLPTGLLYRKDRDCYEFKRIDGSKICLGKDRKQAKVQAIKYNATYRVDVELTHSICATKTESERLTLNKKPLAYFLPDIFNQVCADKGWSANTIKNHKIRFALILKFFGKLQASIVNLAHVNEFLNIANPTDSKEVYNRLLSLMNVIFDYCVSDSVMIDNPAKKKIRRTINAKDEAEIVRLTLNDFRAIHVRAGELGYRWLQIAMELSLQTSHSVLEISKVKYSDAEEFIKIQRQKNNKKAASRVMIPINDELESIISRSRKDNIVSPYIVHYLRKPRYQNRLLGKDLDHHTQLRSDHISRTFSEVRDDLGLYDDIEKRLERPGFHGIRALSIQIQEENGFDAQKRAAHSQRSSTEIYKKGHIQWNEVPDVVIDWRKPEAESNTA